MKINTRIFGEIEIDDSKIIEFQRGIIGFPELTQFVLIHNEEETAEGGIRWLQSLQETGFAIPVIDPLVIVNDYNPTVNDEILTPLGEINEDNMLVLVTITIPSDLTKMSINLKGPIIINSEYCKACQVIIDGDNYPVKFPIYDILQARKEGV